MSYLSFNDGMVASEGAPIIGTISAGSSVASLRLLASVCQPCRPVGAVSLIGRLVIQRWISSLLVTERQ